MASTRRRTRRPGSPGQVQRAIAIAIRSGETFSAALVTLVQNTLVAAMSGARDVGTEITLVGVAAMRGPSVPPMRSAGISVWSPRAR